VRTDKIGCDILAEDASKQLSWRNCVFNLSAFIGAGWGGAAAIPEMGQLCVLA